MPHFATHLGSTPLSSWTLCAQFPWKELPSPVDWLECVLHFSFLWFYCRHSDVISPWQFHKAISLLGDACQLPAPPTPWPGGEGLPTLYTLHCDSQSNWSPYHCSKYCVVFHPCFCSDYPQPPHTQGPFSFPWVSFAAELKIHPICDSCPPSPPRKYMSPLQPIRVTQTTTRIRQIIFFFLTFSIRWILFLYILPTAQKPSQS